MRKDPGTVSKTDTVSLSHSLPQRALQPFTRVSVHWGKGNNEIFWGLLDSGFKLTLIPEDPKYCGLAVKVVTYRREVINGVLGQICLTVRRVVPNPTLWLFPHC